MFTVILVVLGLVTGALLVVRLVAAIRADGYGVNPPPRSHEGWDRQETPPGHRFV